MPLIVQAYYLSFNYFRFPGKRRLIPGRQSHHAVIMRERRQMCAKCMTIIILVVVKYIPQNFTKHFLLYRYVVGLGSY